MTPWQTRQAAMLYFYSSERFLSLMKTVVSKLEDGDFAPLLALAKLQGRDIAACDAAWIERVVRSKGKNHCWSLVGSLRTALAADLGRRQRNVFQSSDAIQCLRGDSRYPMPTLAPDEELLCSLLCDTITQEMSMYDNIVALDSASRVHDSDFALRYPTFEAYGGPVPQFRVRSDVLANTGEAPVTAGVYVDLDDPNASLQFAWKPGRTLRMASTFSDVGLAALAGVGREGLWTDQAKMLEFASSGPYASLLLPRMTVGNVLLPELVLSAVARQAFTARAARWALVEPSLKTPPHQDEVTDEH